MKIHFLRHGIAEEPTFSMTDAERRLTKEGVLKMEREARGMARLGLKWDCIYSSPYPRALETAQIVQKTLGLPILEVAEGLACGYFGLGALQELTKRHASRAELLFVGHEPHLSLLVEQLSGANIEMKKGSLACVETNTPEPDAGILRFLLTPSQLVCLGENT
ncbi:MAG: phosphohistidine phosphatase SixA [Armatimonadetes bacterium]|nr:phosphohistidine phosphatase SixA [Armatimonadota bacterium]